MTLRRRIAVLERASRKTCPGCEPRQIVVHEQRTLADGTVVFHPPLRPDRPPCTCRPPKVNLGIDCIIIALTEEETNERTEPANLEQAL
jgi:hypothetical protein